MTDRRAFLKLLAKSAAYVAPVVATYGVPATVVAQGRSSQHMMMMMMGRAGAAPPSSPPIGGPPPGSPPPRL